MGNPSKEDQRTELDPPAGRSTPMPVGSIEAGLVPITFIGSLISQGIRMPTVVSEEPLAIPGCIFSEVGSIITVQHFGSTIGSDEQRRPVGYPLVRGTGI